MWESIISIIVKYWIEFALGLIVAGATFFIKRYLKFAKEDRERTRKEHYEKMTADVKKEMTTLVSEVNKKYDTVNESLFERYNILKDDLANTIATGREESKRDDAILQNQIDLVREEMSHLKAGLLSMQGKEFKAECRKLLDENHQITLDEWEELDADHEAYNGLGGNHRGDQLFEMVKKKAENIFTQS